LPSDLLVVGHQSSVISSDNRKPITDDLPLQGLRTAYDFGQLLSDLSLAGSIEGAL
jgi:hypothetical protein